MRVLLLPGDKGGCGLYRMVAPARAVASAYPDVEIYTAEGLRGRVTRDTNGTVRVWNLPPVDADVVVFQRPLNDDLAAAIPAVQAQGVACVVELDDDFRNVHPLNTAAAMVTPESSPRSNWRHLMRACEVADLVTVSTRSLTRYAPHGRVRVVGNYLPSSILGLTRPAHSNERPVRVGWTGTVATHPLDLTVTRGAVARVIEDTGSVMTVIGNPSLVARDLGLSQEPTSVPWVDLPHYPQAILDNIDVGIAPLMDTPFNTAKCLDVDTRIATRRGMIPLGEIIPGDQVQCEGFWRKVTAVQRENPTLGVEVVTDAGRRLTLTGNHRLMVNGEWMLAADITAGDTIATTPDMPGAVPHVTAPWPADGRRTRGGTSPDFTAAPDAPRVTITERWGRLLGVFAGDGSCSGKTAITFSCDGQDQDFIDQLMDDLRAVGLAPNTDKVTTWGGEVVRRRSVNVASAHLTRFLVSLGVAEFRDDNMRAKRVVTVPEVIWRSPRPVVAAFLAGLFEADGTAYGTTVSLTSVHERFALDVQRLLASLGIEAAAKWRITSYQHEGEVKIGHGAWTVSLRRAATDVFAAEVGFLSSRKQDRLAVIVARPHSNAYTPQRWWETITEVRTNVPLTPMDIQVEGEVFAAAGFVSHNSALKGLEFAALGIPFVASLTAEYRYAESRGIGVIARGGREWYRLLRRYVDNPGLRDDTAGKARQVVADEFTLEAHAHEWRDAWEQAMRNRDARVMSRAAAV